MTGELAELLSPMSIEWIGDFDRSGRSLVRTEALVFNTHGDFLQGLLNLALEIQHYRPRTLIEEMYTLTVEPLSVAVHGLRPVGTRVIVY